MGGVGGALKAGEQCHRLREATIAIKEVRRKKVDAGDRLDAKFDEHLHGNHANGKGAFHHALRGTSDFGVGIGTGGLAEAKEYGSVLGDMLNVFSSGVGAFAVDSPEITRGEITAKELGFSRIDQVTESLKVDGVRASAQFVDIGDGFRVSPRDAEKEERSQ